MVYNSYRYNRRSIRLSGYDYSQPGYYYITLCTQDRDKKFGVILDKKMQLNDVGRMVDQEWNQIPKMFKHVILDKYIIMPDHFHGIIHIIPNKKIPVNNINPPVCNEINVGTSLVGVHPEKLSVHPELQDHFGETPDVHNEIPDVQNVKSCVFDGSPDDHNEMHDVFGGSQRTGTSPVPTKTIMITTTTTVTMMSKTTTLFGIIGAFKSITTHKYIDGVKLRNWSRFRKRLWQLRYHDHVIRNDNELKRIREYIIANPLNYHPRIQ